MGVKLLIYISKYPIIANSNPNVPPNLQVLHSPLGEYKWGLISLKEYTKIQVITHSFQKKREV